MGLQKRKRGGPRPAPMSLGSVRHMQGVLADMNLEPVYRKGGLRYHRLFRGPYEFSIDTPNRRLYTHFW